MSRGTTGGGRGARAFAVTLPNFGGRAPEGSQSVRNERGGWRDYVALQDRLNQLFEDAAHGGDGRQQGGGRAGEIERADWSPAADVYETAEAFVVAIDLPGIDRATLEVSADDNRLTVRGERAGEEGELQGRGNRPAGRFLSRFGPLPGTVDQKRIAAEYKDGVLRLRLPKRAARQAGKIKIEIK
jgi:HSP20 family protein